MISKIGEDSTITKEYEIKDDSNNRIETKSNWVTTLINEKPEMEKYPGLPGFYQCEKKIARFYLRTWISWIPGIFESRYLESRYFSNPDT